MPMTTIRWTNNAVKIIDQTKLPSRLEYVYCRNVETLWKAIRNLSVRGAPALGIAAGFGVLLGANRFKGKDTQGLIKHIYKVCQYLGTSRPTAVNLFHALNHMKRIAISHPNVSVNQLKKIIKKEAFKIYRDDQRVCRQMGEHGARLIRSGQRLLTVCNAGALDRKSVV